jgi:hypothetical protein
MQLPLAGSVAPARLTALEVVAELPPQPFVAAGD